MQISEHDRELIRELNRKLNEHAESFYRESNATVIAVYRAIVDHKIADENTLKTAQDCLNEWNQSPRKYPHFYHFTNMKDIMDETGDEKMNLWNRWTSGSSTKILIQMALTMSEKEQLWIKMIGDTASHLSDSMKTLLQSSLLECVNETDKHSYLICCDLNKILIKYIRE